MHSLDVETGGKTTVGREQANPPGMQIVNAPALLRRRFGPNIDKDTWNVEAERYLGVAWIYYFILHVKKPRPWKAGFLEFIVHCVDNFFFFFTEEVKGGPLYLDKEYKN